MIGAVEVGGTHVAAGRVDLGSASIAEGSRFRGPVDPHGTRSELLGAIVRASVAAAVPGMERWGVAAPGPFDYENGVCWIEGVAKLEALHGVDLRAELTAALGLSDGSSIRFVNDADAFLLGEWWAGAARGHAKAVGVTLGSGLGSAFLAGGALVHSGAGVFPEGRAHVLAFRGRPVEDAISRRALLARYGAARDGVVDVKEIAERARLGEERARRTFDELGSALAEFLTPSLREFAPTCLVVGGSIARAWDVFGPTLARALRAAVPGLAVTPAALVDDAALLGAARHAASRS